MKQEICLILEELDALTARVEAIRVRLNALIEDCDTELQPSLSDSSATEAVEDDEVTMDDKAIESESVASDDEASVEDDDIADGDVTAVTQPECRDRGLRSAFTINDRYRFRRELFGNSDAEMTDTIDLLSAMADIDEVDDYLFGDLGWERDSEDVVAFMAIVRRQFSDHPANLI